jgi:hypothetical protein
LHIPAYASRKLSCSTGTNCYFSNILLDGRNNVINLFAVQDVGFFTLDPTERLGKNLPGMIIFGNDNGDCIYYFDPINYLGKGYWATYLAYSSRRFEYSSYVARDFTHLIHYILRGDSIYNLGFLQEEGIIHRPD